jgi:hypothetical protein
MIEAARRGLFWYVGTDPVALLSMMAGRSLSWTASATLAFTGLTVSFIGAWFAVRRTT